MGGLLDWLWQNLDDDSSKLQPAEVEIISHLVDLLPDDHTSQKFEWFKQQYHVEFEIWHSKDLQMPLPLLDEMKLSPLKLAESDGHYSYYSWLEKNQKILVIGPFLEARSNAYRVFFSFLFYACFAFVIWIWLWPLRRDLQKLRSSAIDISRGKLHARSQISERSKIGAIAHTFDAMAQRIERLIQSHKELTSAVAHEIKTPLSRAKFALEMLSDNEDDNTFKESIKEDLDEVDTLVAEMLTYASFEQTQPDLHFTQLDINSLIDVKINQLSPLWPQLSFDLKCEQKMIYCDGHFTERAIQNLLTNAAKYAMTQINVHVFNKGEHIVISVEDDGCGIPDDKLESVFKPFTRLDKSRTRASGGFGLGLAIVYRIMQWHGGKCRARRSKSLGGARFEIYFKAKDDT